MCVRLRLHTFVGAFHQAGIKTNKNRLNHFIRYLCFPYPLSYILFYVLGVALQNQYSFIDNGDYCDSALWTTFSWFVYLVMILSGVILIAFFILCIKSGGENMVDVIV